MSAELDPATDQGPPSRAAEVLNRLARERPSGALRRRSWQLRQHGTGHPPDPPIDGRHPGGGELLGARWVRFGGDRRNLGLAIVVLAVLGGISAVMLARRPPPIEDRLPVAAHADAATPSAEGELAPDPASTAAGSSAAGGDGRAPDGGTTPAAGTGVVVVHVAGAVTSPGVVRLSSGSRVVDAVSAAGGLRSDADPDRVNLAAPLTDGQRVVVPVLGQAVPVEVAPAAGAGADGVGDGAGSTTTGPIDLNTATAEELDTLPGVGPSTAAAIIDHRESSGPFRSVDALLDVRGIGEAKLEALRDLVTVAGA